MTKLLTSIKGQTSGMKTYAVGVFLLAYLVIQGINGQPVDQNIVYGSLAAMGITMRMGITKAGKAE